MEIKINKCAKSCAACEREFVHEEEFVSCLDHAEEEESLVRRDFCRACWDADTEREKPYSVWTPRFYDPNVANSEEEEVFSPLRQLFYEAVESASRTEHAKAFLAAQLLKRQKVFRLLKESDESDGEVRLLLYTDRIGSRLIEVRDPNFSYGELEDARKHLLERLRELEAPETESAEPDEAQVEEDAPQGGDAEAVDSEEGEEVAHAAKQDG